MKELFVISILQGTIRIEEGKRVGKGSAGDALTDKTVTKIQIPRTFENKNVVEIGNRAFSETSIISIFIPSTVLCINEYAFYKCSSLKEVRFEKGSKLAKINQGAFALFHLLNA